MFWKLGFLFFQNFIENLCRQSQSSFLHGDQLSFIMFVLVVMQCFHHDHIIALVGICMETPIWIVMELAPYGEVRYCFKSIALLYLMNFTSRYAPTLSRCRELYSPNNLKSRKNIMKHPCGFHAEKWNSTRPKGWKYSSLEQRAGAEKWFFGRMWSSRIISYHFHSSRFVCFSFG